MNLASWLLLAAILLYAGFAFYKSVKGGGSCAGSGGSCLHSCQKCNNCMERVQKNAKSRLKKPQAIPCKRREEA